MKRTAAAILTLVLCAALARADTKPTPPASASSISQSYTFCWDATASQVTMCPAGASSSSGGTQAPTYVSAGPSQFGLGLASATLLTVPTGTVSAQVTVEGNSIRCADDGTVPTAAIGSGPYPPGTTLTLHFSNWTTFRCIQVAPNATINVAYYK